MTLEVSDTEKRAGSWIVYGPDPQPPVAPRGPAEAAEAARALTLDVGCDAGTPR